MNTNENPEDQKGLLNFSFSRRGLFALIATVAGMGLSNIMPRSAEALAGISFADPNEARHFGNAQKTGILTHPDRTQGSNDRLFGYANAWTLWNIYGDYKNRLGYAFAMAVECDYSNELYDHLVFRPFFYFTSYCENDPHHGYWLGEEDGDDNKGTVVLDGKEIGYFQGNFINNNGTGTIKPGKYPWLYKGWDEGSRYYHWQRREGSQRSRNVWSKCEVFNVWHDNIRPSQDIFSTQYAPKQNDMNLNTEKIYLENDLSLMGGIFRIKPLTAPNMAVDLIQGYYEGGKQVARYEDGRGTCLWNDFGGVEQAWIFMPNRGDDRAAFTFCIANMLGPGLQHGLSNSVGDEPTTTMGNALVKFNNLESTRSNSWWVTHEPSTSNETDHKCWFLTSDADGKRLDT